jgi:hypothetical protein
LYSKSLTSSRFSIFNILGIFNILNNNVTLKVSLLILDNILRFKSKLPLYIKNLVKKIVFVCVLLRNSIYKAIPKMR